MDEAIRRALSELEGLPRPELHARLRDLVPSLSLPERFDLLHRLGVYHNPETVSGDASTLAETARMRAALPGLVAELGAGSILDVPCGDFYWMQRVPFSGLYTGCDIVPGLVESNQRRYGSEQRRFLVLDATLDPLPRADLVICRDLFVHLSNRDVLAVLRNLVASGSGWLLTNHFHERGSNPDIESGDFRAINLCQPPFGLPEPRRTIVEDSRLADGLFSDRAMGLWSFADLAGAAAWKS
jgi:SAM-dependent methyltransferase